MEGPIKLTNSDQEEESEVEELMGSEEGEDEPIDDRTVSEEDYSKHSNVEVSAPNFVTYSIFYSNTQTSQILTSTLREIDCRAPLIIVCYWFKRLISSLNCRQ